MVNAKDPQNKRDRLLEAIRQGGHYDGIRLGIAQTGRRDGRTREPEGPTAIVLWPNEKCTRNEATVWAKAALSALKAEKFIAIEKQTLDVVVLASVEFTAPPNSQEPPQPTPTTVFWQSNRPSSDFDFMSSALAFEPLDKQDGWRCAWLENSAEDGTADAKQRVEKTVEAILNGLLLAERPLVAGRMHCIVPMQFGVLDDAGTVEQESDTQYNNLRLAMIGASNAEPEAAGGLCLEESERGQHYFLPHLHKLLVPDAKEARRIHASIGGLDDKATAVSHAKLDERILTFSRAPTPDTRLAVRIDGRGIAASDGYSLRSPTAFLSSFKVHFCCERTLAIEWVLDFEVQVLEESLPRFRLWSAVLASGLRGGEQSAAGWLDFAEKARMVFSAYEAEPSERDRTGDVEIRANSTLLLREQALQREDRVHPTTRRLAITGVLEHAMKQLLKEPLARALPGLVNAGEISWWEYFEIRADDRARSVQSVVLAGGPPRSGPAAEAFEPYCARLAGVDSYSPGYFYDPAFSQEETRRSAYDRYASSGLRYFCMEHNFAFLGFGGYALAPVHSRHMPHLYRRMALVVHLNRAILNSFSREIASAIEGWRPNAELADETNVTVEKKYDSLLPRFLKFANLYWFDQVSTQMQAIELYDLMMKQSSAKREFDFVQDEITRTGQFIAERARRNAEEAEKRAAETDAKRRELMDWLNATIPLAALFGILMSVLSTDILPVIPAMLEAILRPWLSAPAGTPVAAFWAFELSGMASILLFSTAVRWGVLPLPGESEIKAESNWYLIALVHFAIILFPVFGLALGPYGPMAAYTVFHIPWYVKLLVCLAASIFVSKTLIMAWAGRNVEQREELDTHRRVWRFLAILAGLYVFIATAGTIGLANKAAILAQFAKSAGG